ncbi:MAG: plastocyanin/azurin family copper-binding protein [Armatimonadota bacterium]|nr:plastocyanin/azurin family copper-binding protein [Armatimonadota bacterium]
MTSPQRARWLAIVVLTLVAGALLLAPRWVPQVGPVTSRWWRAWLPARGAEITVEVTDNRFLPATLRIPAGATVTWINRGTLMHTTTGIDAGWDGVLAVGQRFSFTFTRAGTYRYLCRPHVLNGMLGTIEVH